MGKLENKFTQAVAGTKNEEKEAAIEKKAAENAEVNISPEQVEVFAKEKESEITKVGENAAQEGSQAFENANQAGAKLELKKEEIDQIAEEMQVGKNLQTKQEEINALTEETKEKIGKVAEVQPESAQEEKINENAETSEAVKETTETTKTAETMEAAGEKPKSPEEGQEKKETEKTLEQKEQEYLSKKSEKAKGLDKRYEDERSSAEHIQKKIDGYVLASGLKHESIPELEGKAFDPETRKIISEKVKNNLETLFKNFRNNPEKYETMAKQSERYLDLMEQAQKEGDISNDASASEILKLAERNIDMMSFQDRVASENMLGDHGVRHVVGFNIKMTEQMLDSIAGKGQEVKAIDRMMGHQIMLMHDLGYATEPVRDEVNKGNLPADKGHNLLSAKILRQMGENPNDTLSKIFSKEQLATMHQGILEHDDSKVEFHVNDGNPASRKENLLSAIHLADNTHAFEDKLPELLYSVPESLKAMRLLKTAGEIGGKDMVESVKNKLVENIKNSKDYSDDDKEALTKAVGGLGESSYKFSVGRICGNKPEVSIGQNGKVNIKVQESAMHQEAVGLFGQQSYDQLKKFIGDLEGKEKEQITDEMLNQEKIEGKNVTIELAIGDKKSTEKTDYQKRIESIVTDKKFVEFSNEDLMLSRLQKTIESEIEEIKKKESKTEEEIIKLAKMEKDISKYKDQRREIYSDYEKN